ncbi:hypothetical protein GCM10007390_03840 [Persicitalea jodogahamensis]|uniref:Uncharacterized protein n=1 Tax=Persicitalea jodogahamensis TaxID=402147 RepID=A0A8J3D6T9_9BACT|nr:hypothetical protein GCM10007390_03840 [Persicitalea jodogahamensis]
MKVPDVIERRYYRGIKNLFDIYLPIVEGVFIYDNSDGEPELLAQKTVDGNLVVLNNLKFKEIENYYDYR